MQDRIGAGSEYKPPQGPSQLWAVPAAPGGPCPADTPLRCLLDPRVTSLHLDPLLTGMLMQVGRAPVSPSRQDDLRPLTWLLICRDRGFPGGTSGKEPACQCRRHKR